MCKRALSLCLSLLLILSLAAGCGNEGVQAPVDVWESRLLDVPVDLNWITALTLDGMGKLLYLEEDQLFSLPLEGLEAAPAALCTLGRTDFSLLCVDASGNYWAGNQGGWVCAYAPDGEALLEYCFSLESGISGMLSLCALPGGGAAATVGTKSGNVQTYAFSLDTAEPTELSALRREREGVYFAGPTPDDSALLGWDDTQIFQVPYGEAAEADKSLEEILEPVTTLEDCGLGGARLQLLGMPDADSILYVHKEAYRLFALDRVSAAEAAEKTILTLAACEYMPDDMSCYIALFNAENPDIQIRPLVYSGVTEMNLAITAGNIPDLVVADVFPFEDYAEKGLFVDLYPYLEREDLELMEGPLRAHETDGKLYRISSGFGLCTFFGHEDHVGSELGWTWEEFYTALEAMPAGGSAFYPGKTRMGIEPFLLSQNMADFVDWSTYTAKFDSENFKSLLSFLNSIPETTESPSMTYEEIMEGMCDGQILADCTTFGSFKGVKNADEALKGGLAFKGFPSDRRQTSYVFPISPLSITIACTDKDAAWGFISGTLSEDYSPRFFPMNQVLFDRQAEETEGLTQAQYEKLVALADAADTMLAVDRSLETIVREETGPYFAGDRSLDETCAIIQTRAQTYVSERKD